MVASQLVLDDRGHVTVKPYSPVKLPSPERFCPDCGNTKVFTKNPEDDALYCGVCGLHLYTPMVERDNHGNEQGTHAATNRLDFIGAKGTLMNYRLLSLYHQKGVISGDTGDLSYLQLSLSGKDAMSTALKYASELLERFNMKNTQESPNQESRFSHITGDELGRIIRKCYRIMDMIWGITMCYGQRRHKLIVEDALAMLLLRSAWYGSERDVTHAAEILKQLEMWSSKRVAVMNEIVFG